MSPPLCLSKTYIYKHQIRKVVRWLEAAATEAAEVVDDDFVTAAGPLETSPQQFLCFFPLPQGHGLFLRQKMIALESQLENNRPYGIVAARALNNSMEIYIWTEPNGRIILQLLQLVSPVGWLLHI